jgi:hypothetical protein
MNATETPVSSSADVPFFSGELWKEQRDEWIEGLVGELRSELAGYLSTEDGWREMVSRNWGHLGSWTNQWWARAQLTHKNPDGIELDLPVLSLSAWKSIGRTIKPEHRRVRGRAATDDRFAVQQLRPMRRRYAVTEVNSETGAEETVWREGQLVGFAVYDAYHLSATEGGEWESKLPARDGSGLERLDVDIEKLLTSEMVRVERGQGPTRLLRDKGRIVLSEDSEGEGRVRELLACVMELLAGPPAKNIDGDGITRRELASHGAAMIVSYRYGLAVDEGQLGDLAAGTAGDLKQFHLVAGDVQRRCRAFLNVCDPTTAALHGAPKRKPPAKAKLSPAAALAADLA